MVRMLSDQRRVACKELAENVASGLDAVFALHVEHSTEYRLTFFRVCVTINVLFNVMKDADYEWWLLEAARKGAMLKANYSVGVGRYIETPIVCASDSLV